MPKLID